MKCMFAAKRTVFVHFQSVGGVFFIFHGDIVALFALCASHSDSYSHLSAPPECGFLKHFHNTEHIFGCLLSLASLNVEENFYTKKEPPTEVI